MRCKDFDAQIGDLLSGVLHPDANQHMRQCERCTSYFRARSAVQSGLRALASLPAQDPSRATDRAVMESYRRVLQGRSGAQPRPGARVVAFPSRGGASSPAARTRWSGLAVAAALLAMVGSGIHLWIGAPTVTAPSLATAPAVSQSPVAASHAADDTLAAENVSRQSLPRQFQSRLQARLGAGRASRSGETAVEPMLAAKAAVAGTAAADGGLEQSTAVPANSIMHLASAGSAAANDAAQSASSTWPGYSNLMYCDPVVCSGPMQVVHIKVPVGQVKPNTGQSENNGFVNAEVVVGPDGVARAIRVAN